MVGIDSLRVELDSVLVPCPSLELTWSVSTSVSWISGSTRSILSILSGHSSCPLPSLPVLDEVLTDV